MRRSAYILLLAVLFFGAAQGLNAIDFWKIAGLPEPRGYLAQGFIFLSLLFLLQNTLFDPYLRVLEERASETTGKKAKAEQTRAEAEKMIARYRAGIAEARVMGTKERELRGIAAEEEERKLLQGAKGRANEQLKVRIEEIRGEADRARGDLRASVEPLATDIVRQTLGISPKGEQLRLLEGVSEP
jgi:F0F1-type ATP synthase membrane subunit b/b'